VSPWLNNQRNDIHNNGGTVGAAPRGGFVTSHPNESSWRVVWCMPKNTIQWHRHIPQCLGTVNQFCTETLRILKHSHHLWIDGWIPNKMGLWRASSNVVKPRKNGVVLDSIDWLRHFLCEAWSRVWHNDVCRTVTVVFAATCSRPNNKSTIVCQG